jgi:hypothetical protein
MIKNLNISKVIKRRKIMNILSRCIAGMLTFFLMGLYFPRSAACADPQMIVKSDEKAITQHEPQFMSTQKKEIPKVKADGKKQKGLKKYLWIGLGTLLVGGGTALALASGGSSNDNPDNNSGDFKAEW